MHSNQLGRTIYKLRIAKGFTMQELAQAVGVDKSYISYLESGAKSNVSLDILKAFAKVFDKTLPELLS
jgi:transcriptional regulator with XRE-family HTH domain